MKTNSSERMRAEAYEILGVTPEDAARTPQITPLLKEFPRKIEQAIEYLRMSDAAEARSWLDKYESLPVPKRKLLPFEAFCLAAGQTPRRMWEVIQGSMFEHSIVKSNMLAAIGHADVTKATVYSATIPGKEGTKDREMLHKHAGFVPVPSKNVVFGTQHVHTGGQDQQADKDTLPPVAERVRRISNRFGDLEYAKALPPAPEIADAEVEEE